MSKLLLVLSCLLALMSCQTGIPQDLTLPPTATTISEPRLGGIGTSSGSAVGFGETRATSTVIVADPIPSRGFDSSGVANPSFDVTGGRPDVIPRQAQSNQGSVARPAGLVGNRPEPRPEDFRNGVKPLQDNTPKNPPAVQGMGVSGGSGTAAGAGPGGAAKTQWFGWPCWGQPCPFSPWPVWPTWGQCPSWNQICIFGTCCDPCQLGWIICPPWAPHCVGGLCYQCKFHWHCWMIGKSWCAGGFCV